MLALIDANSFYCSAEQVFRPEWRGKPIVVLSNDGTVVAANKQAMALGIEKFKPYFQLKAICDRHDIQVCSSNYELVRGSLGKDDECDRTIRTRGIFV